MFQASVSSGTLTPGQSLAVGVQASALGPARNYSAQLSFSFAGGTTRVANLPLILAPGAIPSQNAGARDFAAASACTATKLLPVFTLLADNFTVPAAWPTALEAVINDDSGIPLSAGSADVAFSNGEPPLRMTSDLNGRWSVTWPPVNPRASGIVLTLTARKPEANLSGSVQITGGGNANPDIPIVSPGGVVETASYASPAAPGNLIAIFGTKLATSIAQAGTIPLPETLATTSAMLGNQLLPLLYTSDGQVNAVVPYGLTTSTRYQLLIQRGNSLSVPQSVLIGVARPAAFTLDGSGQGQGHVYKTDAQGNQILTDKNSPAKAGDVLVIYCSGLGAVDPPLTAGTGTPLGFSTKAVAPVSMTCLFPDMASDDRYPCPGTPAIADILQLVGALAVYAVDTLLMTRARTWNYRRVNSFDGSLDGTSSVARRERCSLCTPLIYRGEATHA